MIIVGSGGLIGESWSVVELIRAVSAITSVLIGVSRLSLVSVRSGFVSGVRGTTKLLRVPSPKSGGLSFVVVFIFGLWGPIGGFVVYCIWKMFVNVARL